MRLDPRSPVLVGVGQVTNRPDPSDGDSLVDRPEPISLMVEAARVAAADCGGARPGASSGAGSRLLARVQSVRAIDPLSWQYVNPAGAVATQLGLHGAESVVAATGGDSPQRMMNAVALSIGRGQLEAALLVGADCLYSQTAAQRHPNRPMLPWTVQAAGAGRPVVFGQARRGTTDAEEARGLDLPVNVYPLFENAFRAAAGRSLDEHRNAIGELWARGAEVAATNPYAWLRAPVDAEEIAAVSDENRMVAYPYTELLTANTRVDQGAALLVCSVEAAEAAGVPRDRWVFPVAGADADDHWFLSHRRDFHSSPAIRLAGQAAMAGAGTDVDGIAHLDLYSCFPSAVEIAGAELGIPLDDPSRPFTVTGGLTFAGGPGDNYTTHAIAAMASTLRDDPGSSGLVTGLGWYLTKHSLGVYSTRPPGHGDGSEGDTAVPGGVSLESAAGFRWADPQAAIGALPQCSPDADAEGEICVETYSVAYDRGGAPVRGVVACRTPEGFRAWAMMTDPGQLSDLVEEEGCGRIGVLRTDGELVLS